MSKFSFHKYFQLFLLSWQNGFVYRTSLILWRLRQVLWTLMALTVWSVLFQTTDSLFSYSKDEMIAYIFTVAILTNAILTTSLNGLSQTIYSGALSFDLVKPINIYLNLFTQDIADKAKNIFFIFIETILLFLYFHPVITLPPLLLWIPFLLWIIGGVIIHFFIQLIFGSLGFWSPDTWGPRFLFFMLVDFTAGRLFPLDILPIEMQRVLFLTPFPYFSFMQIQLFLGRLSTLQIIQNSCVIIFWILLLGFITRSIWDRGIKDYAAAGQ